MKRWHSCDFTISILVECDDDINDPVEIAEKKIEKIKLPEYASIMDGCMNVSSEGEELEIV